MSSLEGGTKKRHAIQDNLGFHTQGKLQAKLLKPVFNA